jgi:hypothetical protein
MSMRFCGTLMFGALLGGLTACASTDSTEGTSQETHFFGGGAPNGGTPESGGSATGTGGHSVANGGSGGRAGTGGRTGASGGPVDAGCTAPNVLLYTKPGCDQAPVCDVPNNDACLSFFCGCDGTNQYGGCGFATKPFRHFGDCTDADYPNPKSDSGVDATAPGAH